MSFCDELSRVFWDEGLPLEALYREHGLAALLHLAQTWQPELNPLRLERYLQRMTKTWTTDYAFVIRFAERRPVVAALLDRLSPTVVRWVYLTGGRDESGQEMCGADVVKAYGAPVGLIRQVLSNLGIEEVQAVYQLHSAMARGAADAGYILIDRDDGKVEGTLQL